MENVAQGIFLDADDLTKNEWKSALGFSCFLPKMEQLHALNGNYDDSDGFAAINECFGSLIGNPKFDVLIQVIIEAFEEAKTNTQSSSSDSS